MAARRSLVRILAAVAVVAGSFAAGVAWREWLYRHQLHEVVCTATTHIVIPQLQPPKGYKCT